MDTVTYLAACYSNWLPDQVIELDYDCYVRFF
jgi:hypothetical protein